MGSIDGAGFESCNVWFLGGTALSIHLDVSFSHNAQRQRETDGQQNDANS